MVKIGTVEALQLMIMHQYTSQLLLFSAAPASSISTSGSHFISNQVSLRGLLLLATAALPSSPLVSAYKRHQ